MRIVAVGVDPIGLIAIGSNATGIIAIGQLATGVVAIGQLARGGIAVGQLALGLVSIGQLSVGVCWSVGIVGIGTISGPGFILGLFGRFPREAGGKGRPVNASALQPWRITVGTALAVAIAAGWWFWAGAAMVDALTRPGGILIDLPQ